MSCTRYNDLRDYALGELPGAECAHMETHIASCASCTEELHRLRLTTTALHALPDREIPQRIGFVSDKIFAPSPVARFFGSFWNSASRLGFASAGLLGAAITFHALHQSEEIRTVVQTPATVSTASVSAADLDAAVNRAVAKVREEDARSAKLAVAAVERKYEEKQKALMISVQENFEVMQKRLSSYQSLAYYDASREPNRVGGQ